MLTPSVPQSIKALPAWHKTMQGRLKLLDVSFSELEKRKTTISFAEEDPNEFAARAHADITENHIEITISPKTPIGAFCERISHEAKHISQSMLLPERKEWSFFKKDIKKSWDNGTYELKPHYDLPSVSNDIVLRTTCELDAHLFGALSDLESQILFTPETTSRTAITQPLVEEYHDAISKEDTVINDWANDFIEADKNTLLMLAALQQRHKRTPTIRWIAVSSQDIAASYNGLWKEAGLTTPFLQPQGIKLITDLREKFVSHQTCSTLMLLAQKILAGQFRFPAPQPQA